MGLRLVLGAGLPAALEEGYESRIKAGWRRQWARAGWAALEVSVDMVNRQWEVLCPLLSVFVAGTSLPPLLKH